jgi:peptidoglycan hydrolase-like protein with peptidoglycan-binding domain
MKRLILFATLVLTAGLLYAGLSFGTDQAGRILIAQSGQMQNEMTVVPLDEDQIRQLQVILQNKGYDVGEESGTIGPETTRALKEFQEDKGLAVTGTPTEETLRTLVPTFIDQEYFGLAPEFL